MRNKSSLALVGMFGVVVVSAACGRSDSNRADSALANDLALAAQAHAYQPLDSLSAAERAAAGAALAGGAATAAPVRSSPTPARTTSGTPSRTTTSSGGSVQRAPEQREVVVKHTKRDAAIGAAAGAIIGAAASKDKVKGGVIGAAVGGIVGGVIGNNVDKTKKKVP